MIQNWACCLSSGTSAVKYVFNIELASIPYQCLMLCQFLAIAATLAMARSTEVRQRPPFLDTAACLGIQTCFTKSFMSTALRKLYSLAWGRSLTAGEKSSCLPCICKSRDGCIVEGRRARNVKAGVIPGSE